jgi:uncharacterized SAM-dependent methyltransferase
MYPIMRNPDNKEDLVCMGMTDADKQDIEHSVSRLLPLDRIAKQAKKALDMLESTDIKAKVEIEITKIGIVPEGPPDERFNHLPEDIVKGDIFASGRMRVPIPVCSKNDANPDELNWKMLEIGFSFYRSRRMDRPKIIFSIFPYEQTSGFLKPSTERVAERQAGFERLRKYIFRGKIPIETFIGLKEKFEPIFERWLRDHVQKMVDTGEFSKIVGAVEAEKTLFKGSDLKIDSVLNGVDDKLRETLKSPSGNICVPSYQSWAGTEAQQGWLKLCQLPSYAEDYFKKEIDFLTQNGERISQAAGDPDHILFFGIGNFEKEAFLLKMMLGARSDKEVTVHGIDIGTEFHLCAFKGMADIRKETGKPVKYRGHIALFESAPDIADYIHDTHRENETKILRICLGNTFGNFSKDENPWEDLAGSMKKGERLLISADIVQRHPSEEIRKAKIEGVLARYQSREWKQWVLNPLYRAVGLNNRWIISPDNVEIAWDEATHGVVFKYRFPEKVVITDDLKFAKDEVIELHRSRKIDPDRLNMEAGRNGFEVKDLISNEAGNFGYFLLEKL